MRRQRAILTAVASAVLAACSPADLATVQESPSPTVQAGESQVAEEPTRPTPESTPEPTPEPTPVDPTENRDPCHEIAEEEVESALGYAVDALPRPGGASCTFAAVDDPTRTVVMKHEAPTTDLNNARAAVEDSFGVTPSAVGGVGEDAFSYVHDLGEGLFVVGVVATDGASVVNVAVTGPDSFAALESSTNVARLLLERDRG